MHLYRWIQDSIVRADERLRARLAGKPVIPGTRLAAEFILGLLAAGQSESEILADYPGLTREDILACVSYASHVAHEYKAYPLST